jgi:rubrerythrin
MKKKVGKKKPTGRKVAKKVAKKKTGATAKRKIVKKVAKKVAKTGAKKTARPSTKKVASNRAKVVRAMAEAATPLTVKQALMVALEFEKKVRDRYALGAEAIKDPQGSKVFATLAKEEQGHVDYIESRLVQLDSTGSTVAETLKSILPSHQWVKDAEAKHRATVSLKRIAEEHELELLKEALQAEKDASAFYNDLVRRLPEADRPLFEQFLNIEDGHVAIVQAELDSVQGLGFWFDVPEFALEAM